MGVKVDAFQAAVYVGVTRFVCSTMTVFLLRGVGIRKPMLGSSFGMAVCMMLSGYFTLYPEKSKKSDVSSNPRKSSHIARSVT